MKTVMKQYSKTLDENDYNNFEKMYFVENMKDGLRNTFYECHHHRNWEYGLCLDALQENQAKNILEIGGTGSLFAATAAWIGMEVTVVDPSGAGTSLFAMQNLIMQLGHAPITFEQVDFLQYQNRKKFDAVVCISTLEHVEEDEVFFKKMLNLVKEGGICFITMDFHPSGQKIVNEHLRTYNQESLATFIAIAQKHGFEVFGDAPDYSWRGESVFNYTFASLALKRKKREKPVVFFVNNREKQRDGVYQFGKRAGNILENSSKYHFIYLETDSKKDFLEKIEEFKPSAIIYNLHCYNIPWLDSEILSFNRSKEIVQINIFHDRPFCIEFDYSIGTYPDFPENAIAFSAPRPLFEYENTYSMSAKIPIINCFGFIGRQDFEKAAQMINREFDHAVVNFHMPHNDLNFGGCPKETAAACRSIITKKNIQLNITHEFMSNNELLDFLAQGSLNVFLYKETRGLGCASTLDFALSVKKPIAITRNSVMSHIYNTHPSICVEDRSLKEIMASGFEPLEPYYEKWKPEKFIEAYEKIMEKVL